MLFKRDQNYGFSFFADTFCAYTYICFNFHWLYKKRLAFARIGAAYTTFLCFISASYHLDVRIYRVLHLAGYVRAHI